MRWTDIEIGKRYIVGDEGEQELVTVLSVGKDIVNFTRYSDAHRTSLARNLFVRRAREATAEDIEE